MSGPAVAASVSKAGSRIRRLLRDPSLLSEDPTLLDRYLEDCEVVFRHRDSHTRATASANSSLRYHCSQLGLDEARVTQRIKRFPTILEKLQREPSLNLARMHDLGGVRAVVPTINDVRALQERILERHSDAKVFDYITTPRQSGYRAVHVVADWARAPRRPVEIQLRSTVMHQWANMVETASGAFGVNHKQDGDTPFHRWAKALSLVMEAQESGCPVSEALADEYDSAYIAFFEDEIGDH